MYDTQSNSENNMISYRENALALIVPVANKEHEKLLLSSLLPVLAQTRNLNVFIVQNYTEDLDPTVRDAIFLYTNKYHLHKIIRVVCPKETSLGKMFGHVLNRPDVRAADYIWKFDCDIFVPFGVLKEIQEFVYEKDRTITLMFNMFDVKPITKGQSVFPLDEIMDKEPMFYQYKPTKFYTQMMMLNSQNEKKPVSAGTFIFPSFRINEPLLEELNAMPKGQRGTDNLILSHMRDRSWLYPANVHHLGCIFYEKTDYENGGDYINDTWKKGY